MSTRSDDVDPYRPPQAALAEPDIAEPKSFYVVAPLKFLLLMVGTFGVYQLYWFYKNWALLNVKHQSYWPVMRAIFAIFFTHALFQEVDGELKKRPESARYEWSPGLLAGVYIVTAILSQVFSRVARDLAGPAYFVSLAALGVMIGVLFQAQKAINLASGDPDGRGNAAITFANIAWLLLGALLWLGNLLALFAVLSGKPLR